MGVWIEIIQPILQIIHDCVTPLVGVWIEIAMSDEMADAIDVTPLVGVWIEINTHRQSMTYRNRHSPCGSVD